MCRYIFDREIEITLKMDISVKGQGQQLIKYTGVLSGNKEMP